MRNASTRLSIDRSDPVRTGGTRCTILRMRHPNTTLIGGNFSNVTIGGNRGCSFSIFSGILSSAGNKGILIELAAGSNGRVTRTTVQISSAR